MEGYQFTSLPAPGSAPAGNSLQFHQQPTNQLISYQQQQQQFYYEYQQPNCSTDYLFAPSQNSPSNNTYTYTDSNTTTQAIYNNIVDFTTTTNSFTAAVSNHNHNNHNINNVITYIQEPVAPAFTSIVPESFDFEGLFQDSSVFLSPQSSAASVSSASQSPEQPQFFASKNDVKTANAADCSLDLSLDELLQNIGSEEENINFFGGNGVTATIDQDDGALVISDELLEVLAKDVEEYGEEEAAADFFSELNFADEEGLGVNQTVGGFEVSSNTSSVCSPPSDFLNSSSSSSPSSNSSSVSSTPKRKYSSSSSFSNYSEASYQTSFNGSSSGNSSEPEDAPKSEAVEIAKSKPNNNNKRARRRTPKASPVEKAARKKDQNKRAACRYRSKKRVELQSSEMTMEELEAVRDGLSAQVRKLQTEFSVILPLARAAFAFDAVKREHLQALLARVEGMLS